MKKFIVFAIAAGLLFCSAAMAAVTITNNGTNVGLVEKINFTTGTTATRSGSVATVAVTGASATPTITGGTINGATVGVTTPAAGKFTTLTATGVMVDAAIYGGAAGVGLVNFVCISADGKFFGKSTNCN